MEEHKHQKINRRGFLKINTGLIGGLIISKLELFAYRINLDFLDLVPKRIYIALDDHTDYMWTADEATYRQSFIDMIDYYLDLADETENNPSEHQSRFNCDGSLWLWTYEKYKSPAEYNRLIDRIRDGHISVPLNPLVILYGGVPAEAVLRGMYYPGKIERRENLRFRLAVSMENQTLPYGLGSLWAGAGAKYSWKGICGCATNVIDPGDREHDIYWWLGPDGSRILMKWNTFQNNQGMGGYAEARDPGSIVEYVDTDELFKTRYPFSIIGAFGKGWDDLETFTDEFVNVAKQKTNENRIVIVSNEEDFFDDFNLNFGSTIPTISVSYGNEWDLYCASMAEVSARVKRAVEKLRSAEAIASLVNFNNPNFMVDRTSSHDLAWINLGLYWEHDWTADGGISRDDRRDWQRRLADEIENYVDKLLNDAIYGLGEMIENNSTNRRYFVFNPLCWVRSDYADIPYNFIEDVHVIDLSDGTEIPSQHVSLNDQSYLRIFAHNIPSIGYKVFEVRKGQGQIFQDAATITNGYVENQYYQVEVSQNGAITSWIDKTRDNRQLVKIIDGRTINDLGTSIGNIAVENVGPVTVTILATANYPLKHTTRITFIRESRRIEIKNYINQNFNDIYTWGFGFNLSNPDVWHEEVGAVIRAKLSTQNGHYSPRNARYDWLTLNHFADMSEASGYGVTLSNADCYFMRLGNSTTSTLDTITPQFAPLVGGQVDGPGLGITNQGGDTQFLQRFALVTHDSYDPNSAMKFSLEHQNPLVTGEVTGGSEYPEFSYSFLSIDNPEVLLWALKPADDGTDAGIITRLWNLSSQDQNFKLSLTPGKIQGAAITSHIETPEATASLNNGALDEVMGSHQIKTFALFLTDPPPIINPNSYRSYIPLIQKYEGSNIQAADMEQSLKRSQYHKTLKKETHIKSNLNFMERLLYQFALQR